MEKYQVGIILGHIYTGFAFTSRQKKRMDKGIELFNTGQVAKLMTTGGKGMFKKTAPSMGQVAKDYLIDKGISATHILVEDQSINTWQNAQFALHLMQQHDLNSAIIITSADHMQRAQSTFLATFSDNYRLHFVVSDHFAGIWSIIDSFWNVAGKLKHKFQYVQNRR